MTLRRNILALQQHRRKVESEPDTPIVTIPSEYQQVEYIESKGGQYIDTGYTIQFSDIELNAILEWSKLNNERQLTGGDNVQWIGINGNKWDLGSTNGTVATNVRYDCRLQVTYGSDGKYATLYVNDNTMVSYSGAATAIQRNRHTIFGLRTVYGVQYNCYCKMFSYSIKDGGELRFNGIPCYRKSDNKPGMYDTVRGIFLTNGGTGEFTVGPVI